MYLQGTVFFWKLPAFTTDCRRLPAFPEIAGFGRSLSEVTGYFFGRLPDCPSLPDIAGRCYTFGHTSSAEIYGCCNLADHVSNVLRSPTQNILFPSYRLINTSKNEVNGCTIGFFYLPPPSFHSSRTMVINISWILKGLKNFERRLAVIMMVSSLK